MQWRALALSVGLLACAALAYEVLLLRLLAIIQWQPFAAMIVSLALFGHGAAGTALALAGQRLLPRFDLAYALSAALFALAVPLCYAAAQRLEFNGLELAWNLGQLPRLAALYLLLSLPFFFAAACFGLAFMHRRERVAALYASDLLGAGLGVGAAVLLLFLMPAGEALRAVSLAGATAAFLVSAPFVLRLALPLLVIGVAMLLPGSWLAPQITEFKGLPRALHVMGANVVAERTSPYGLLSVVRNDAVPFRHAPGRSLQSRAEPPMQLGVFTDGDGMTAITSFDGNREQLAYLDELTSALPYQLVERPRTLVLGAGGGADVLQALFHDASEIHAVELNPQMVELVRGTFGEFAGRIYEHPAVRVHVADARGFVRADAGRYDLIQLAPLDSFAGAGAGVHAVAESYLYTVEALRDYYAHLSPGGYLALTRWEKYPPRESLKLFATAVSALRAETADPAAQLAMIRGWQTSTLLVKRGALQETDLARIRQFCDSRGFDLAYLPGLKPEETNRHHRLARDWLHEGALALLGPEADSFVESYKFNISPATDDRPYFFHFFRWPLLPELLALRGQGGVTLLDTGYLVLAGTLAQAIPLALLLILAPLGALRREAASHGRTRPALYFLCLGLGFLFVEIACLQRYSLFIGHPLAAAVAVLAGFLVFAGAGSLLASRIDRRRALIAAVAGIVMLLGIQAAFLPLPPGYVEPMSGRVALTLGLIAPLAFLMGMPFPLGLARLAAETPAFIPWAWGINGCASVLAALLAALLAVHAGYTVVLLAAAGFYLLAVIAWR